jgi:hypothetical protein
MTFPLTCISTLRNCYCAAEEHGASKAITVSSAAVFRGEAAARAHAAALSSTRIHLAKSGITQSELNDLIIDSDCVEGPTLRKVFTVITTLPDQPNSIDHPNTPHC